MSYPNVFYTHQGWLTEDQKFFIWDELDELNGGKTRTLVFDLNDLDNPLLHLDILGLPML